MKLKSFKIQSYKSCKKTELQLNEELTCLIGVNGSGKTNILNAILLFKKLHNYRSKFYISNEFTHEQCKFDVEFLYQGNELFLQGSILFDIDENNEELIIDSTFNWNFSNFIDFNNWIPFPIDPLLFKHILESINTIELFEDNNQNKIIIPSPKNNLAFPIEIPKNINIESFKELVKIINFVLEYFNNTSYYSASVFSNPSKCPNSIEFDANRPKYKLRNNREHEKFIIDLYSLSKKKEIDFKSYLNLVNKSGIGLVDDISFTEVPLPSQSYEVKSAENIKINESKRLLVVPNFQIDGYNLSPNQLSEGTFRTLALIFYILNDDSKLLLIEEPEVCVHHGLLSSIIELIKSQSKHKQIIISTHSDFVLDQLEPENIVLVKRDDKKGTTTKSLTKSMSKNDYKALRNYLNETGNLGEYWKEGGFDNE